MRAFIPVDGAASRFALRGLFDVVYCAMLSPVDGPRKFLLTPLVVVDGRNGPLNERLLLRPSGVRVVARSLLIVSIGLFVLFFMGILLSGLGGPDPLAGQHPNYYLLAFLLAYPIVPASLVLSVFAFLLSQALLATPSKKVWYASILFFVVFFLLFVWFGDSSFWRFLGEPHYVDSYFYQLVLVSFFPLVWSLACLAYLQTAKVKHYFGIGTA